ncbi:MAG: hypothetical protein RL385_5936 [Pseudomonadota bacterium]|jgi:2-polyprenyl-6-methoxyphenol hydroxylase-like FAD-dependent oxidoreductase
MEQASSAVAQHEVVIAGGGPTGLMLAGELRLAGVDVAIVEPRPSHALEGLRAGGLHIRALELLEQRGLAERFLAEGQLHTRAPFAGSTLDLSDAPSRHPHFLALWQTHVERLLGAWASALGATMYRGVELCDFADEGTRVQLQLSGGRALACQWLVGCDGGRSQVRQRAGIAFPGWEPATSYLIAELELGAEPPWGARYGSHGAQALARLDDGRARVVLSGPYVEAQGAPTLDDVRAALHAAYGSDFGLRRARNAARFSDVTRQAEAYRAGRVLLAGDAAHVHSPVGGQGLNLGLQDAVNLGWKLGAVVRGTLPESVLDSYHMERHAAGARVLRTTMGLSALQRGDARTGALRETLAELMTAPAARAAGVALSAGLDVRYELGDGHPLLGRRMPDLAFITSEGPVYVPQLLREARPLLLALTGTLPVGPFPAHLCTRTAHHDGPWCVPGVGEVAAPTAVLVRPDGHVAWVGEGSERGLREAIARWVGANA